MADTLTQTLPPPSAGAQRRPLPAWMREPLLHFLLIGAVLFAADHAFSVRRDDPRTIVVGDAVDREARDTFRAARGSDPTPEQLAALHQVWLDNELLYREGLALRVDQGDATIRDRVIFKALNVVEANLKLPPVDEVALRAWFEQHRAKYDEPPRLDFHEAVLAGDNGEAAVRAFVAELQRGGGGELKAGLRVFTGRPQGSLAQSYGADFARALAGGPAGEWRALPTSAGWRAVRLDAVTPGRAAVFEPLRGVVLQDWTDATMAELRTAAVRGLASKYRIVREGAK